MEIKIRCSVCGLLMIIEELSSSKAHSAIVMHVSPCPCSSRPTPRALDETHCACKDEAFINDETPGCCGNCGKPFRQ